jgi:hypothetical protein
MWGLVNPKNEVVREETNIDPTVSTKPGWCWLSIIEQPSPKYNTKLQTLEGLYYRVLDDHVEKFWHVRDKTLEERDYEIKNQFSAVPEFIITILHAQENKIRELQQLPTLNREEFLEYIKSVIQC